MATKTGIKASKLGAIFDVTLAVSLAAVRIKPSQLAEEKWMANDDYVKISALSALDPFPSCRRCMKDGLQESPVTCGTQSGNGHTYSCTTVFFPFNLQL